MQFKKLQLKRFYLLFIVLGISLFIISSVELKAEEFLDDTDSNWNAGTLNNMEVQGSGSAANITSTSGSSAGSFGSQIFDAINTNANWTNISIVVEVPYGAEIGRASNDSNEVSSADADKHGFLDTDNLVLLYHLNNEEEESGILIKDFSVDINTGQTVNNNGTCSGSVCPTYDSTRLRLGNGSMNFDGANDELDAGSRTSLDNMNVGGVTISAWIYPETEGELNSGSIVSKLGGDADFPDPGYNFHIDVDGTNTLEWVVGFSDSHIELVASNSVLTLNTWQHVALTWDGSITATNSHIYVDGVEVSYQETTNGAGSYASDAAVVLTVGNVPDGSRTFDGNMDEVVVFNRVLTSQEIYALYKRGDLRLNLSVRSCDDSVCDGESYQQVSNLSFMGGKIRNLSTGSGGLPVNRYFQYNLSFSSDATDKTTDRVVINNVTIQLNNLSVVAADTCSPTSPLTADHTFQCSDNCIITTALDAGGNNILITGTGTFTTTARISNFKDLRIQGTDADNICAVRCENNCFED